MISSSQFVEEITARDFTFAINDIQQGRAARKDKSLSNEAWELKYWPYNYYTTSVLDGGNILIQLQTIKNIQHGYVSVNENPNFISQVGFCREANFGEVWKFQFEFVDKNPYVVKASLLEDTEEEKQKRMMHSWYTEPGVEYEWVKGIDMHGEVLLCGSRNGRYRYLNINGFYQDAEIGQKWLTYYQHNTYWSPVIKTELVG